MLKKKIWAKFQRIIELFTQKVVSKLSKIWVWDPGSGFRNKPIPDTGSRGQKGTGSRIRIRNTDKILKFKQPYLWLINQVSFTPLPVYLPNVKTCISDPDSNGSADSDSAFESCRQKRSTNKNNKTFNGLISLWWARDFSWSLKILPRGLWRKITILQSSWSTYILVIK
jgi:hypothetical protein